MNIFSIYIATNNVNGKSYIGFDSYWPRRKSVHISTSKKTPKTHFHKALSKYGSCNFTWTVLYQSKDKEHTLSVMENHFITSFNTFNEGYNETLGGEGTLGKRSWLGRKHTNETRQKMSDSAKGKTRSKEHQDKLSASLKGRPKQKWSDERKRQHSQILSGRIFTEQHKQKLRDNVPKGGKHPSSKPITIDGVRYTSKSEARQYLGFTKYQMKQLIYQPDTDTYLLSPAK